jgi:hypothetical protein
MKAKHLYYSLGGAVLILVAFFAFTKSDWFTASDTRYAAAVSNFEECIAAGLPILESYPRQCRSAAGEMFSEDIGNELEKADLIVIDSPRPNELIKGLVSVSGRARGPWYFEASFPVVLVDENGNELATAIAQAEGEWMTENFVPFKASLNIPDSFNGKAKLILKKDNPSGEPQFDDELIVPVVIN